MKKLLNYIGGELVEAQNGKWLDVIQPATGSTFAAVAASDASDVQLAVDAAKRALPGWSQSSITFRYERIMKLVELIDVHFDKLSQAESMDNGKPLWLAKKVDIPRAKSNFEFFATAIQHFATNAHEMTGAAINYTLRQPLGIVGCISPWNLPLYLFTWKIAPALAAGNCVIAKPSEVTPFTAYLLSELCIEAGFPDGVLNIVHGSGHQVGSAMVAHPDIKAISFTGSTKTGEQIASIAAPMFKKLSLEMGGKNPNIIFSDCDFDRMMSTTMRSSFANQGQICLCGSRIFIEESLYEKFKSEFVSRTKELRVGPPNQASTKIGAVVSEDHMNKILRYIDLAKEEGGSILCGGHRVEQEAPNDNGFFVAPTIIEGLTHDCRVNQEEIFGPVVTIMPFKSEDEVIRYANSTKYGLSATLWTSDLSRAHRVAGALEAGIVWINTWLLRDLRTPFGGVKDSGVGREGGWEALRFFTEPKNICIAY